MRNTIRTDLKQPTDTNSSTHTGSRCENQQQTDHYRSKVDTQGNVNTHKHDVILTVAEDVVQAYGGEEYGKVDVEEIGAPGCSLMLGYGGYNRDVFLGVGGVEKGH